MGAISSRATRSNETEIAATTTLPVNDETPPEATLMVVDQPVASTPVENMASTNEVSNVNKVYKSILTQSIACPFEPAFNTKPAFENDPRIY